MATWVIEGPPLSPTQIISFAKKVQTIIRRCMVSIGGTLGCTPSQHDIQQTFPVQPSRCRPLELRGARKLPGRGAREGRASAPPDMGRGGHAPPPLGTGSSSFQAAPPPGTVGSSTPHMPISITSSSDTDEHNDERTDEVTPVQQLGFGHRVGKKTTRFTPSDWP
ncbi:hypothetical protein M9H77_12074 [Catharanthus roseus]|uniref:Uncharacterized protein n=1 Tax=Catharanthus roseus TaxID=4058 RepID=A0ACC0BGE9_CATRO|nr:hypothetical protein M9H77_12074 [Catharanthus roseus]